MKFQIVDRLINKSEYEKEFQIIYHSNFGRPLLEKDARFVAPVKTCAPLDDYAARDLATYERYLGPTNNFGEQVYCLTMNSNENEFSTVMLQNAAAERGVAMRYSTSTLPYFTLWKNTDTETDGYVTGLEPATGFPYNRSVERNSGRVPKLAAGGEVVFEVAFEILLSSDEVTKVGDEIAGIHGDQKPTILKEPPRKFAG